MRVARFVLPVFYAVMLFVPELIFGQSLKIDNAGMSVEELILAAEKGNVELNAAARGVNQAERNLEGPLTLEKSKLSLGSRYDYLDGDSGSGGGTQPGGAASSESHALSASADLSLPIIPQLLLGGSVKLPLYDSSAGDAGPKEVSGSLSLTAYPFAGSVFTAQSSAAYNRALYSYQYAAHELSFSVEKAVLGLLTASMERSDGEDNLDIAREEYEITKEKYEIGEADFDELSDKSDALTEARQHLYTREKDLLSAERMFYGTIGTSLNLPKESDKRDGDRPDDIAIKPVPLEELSEGVENRERIIETVRKKVPESLKLTLLRVELEEMKSEEEATWAYRPDLSLTAAMDIPLAGFSAGITYSFSPANVKVDEKTTLKENILSKEEEIIREMYYLEKEKEMLLSQIQTAAELVNLSRSAREDALLTLEETQFLAEEGDRTTIELARAELSLETKKTDLYAAMVDLYTLQGELLLLFRVP